MVRTRQKAVPIFEGCALMYDAVASSIMRTTLSIDDDILHAARELGKRNRKSIGQVISDLAREALTRSRGHAIKEPKGFYGVRPLPPAPGKIVTNEMIDRLREEELI